MFRSAAGCIYLLSCTTLSGGPPGTWCETRHPPFLVQAPAPSSPALAFPGLPIPGERIPAARNPQVGRMDPALDLPDLERALAAGDLASVCEAAAARDLRSVNLRAGRLLGRIAVACGAVTPLLAELETWALDDPLDPRPLLLLAEHPARPLARRSADCADALARAPHLPRARLVALRLALEQAPPLLDDARVQLAQLAEHGPDTVEECLARAEWSLAEGDARGALQILLGWPSEIASEPDMDPDYLALRAALQLRVGDRVAGTRDLEAVLYRWPTHPLALQARWHEARRAGPAALRQALEAAETLLTTDRALYAQAVEHWLSLDLALAERLVEDCPPEWHTPSPFSARLRALVAAERGDAQVLAGALEQWTGAATLERQVLAGRLATLRGDTAELAALVSTLPAGPERERLLAWQRVLVDSDRRLRSRDRFVAMIVGLVLLVAGGYALARIRRRRRAAQAGYK